MRGKKIYVPVIAVVLMTLLLGLTGCKKFVMPTSFTSDFGKKEYRDVAATNLKAITVDDTPLTAWAKMRSNYQEVTFLASRNLIDSRITGLMTINETIYSTRIRSKEVVSQNIKIYNEDSSKSDKGSIGFGIVKTMGYINSDGSKQSYLVKDTTTNVVEDNNGMLSSDEKNFDYHEYDNYDDYVADYYMNINDITDYIISSTTIDLTRSTVTKNEEGFIEVKFVFLGSNNVEGYTPTVADVSTLQASSLISRKTIAKKAVGGLVASCNYEDVKYNYLEMKFTLWASGNLRSCQYKEQYDMTAKLTIGGSQSQTVTNTANMYYSNDPEELPISYFEFTKKK